MMSFFISASSPATTVPTTSSQQQPKTPSGSSSHHSGSVVIRRTRPTAPNLSLNLYRNRRTAHVCAAGPGFPGSAGEEDTKGVLDAFFLGKAVGEALTERLEASVGEFLSIIGRLQAEQQKQVQVFRDDVLEKAKRAKDQAAVEALKSKGGVIPRPPAFDAKAASSTPTFDAKAASSSPTFDANTVSNATTTVATTSASSINSFADESDPESSGKGPLIGVPNDD